ncbi:MAG: rhomboid family intramembrane serine protease [Myxococcota bacterium]
MFPIRDENPTLSRSVVTIALVAANVLSWVLIQGLGTEPALSKSVCELGAIPGELLGRVPPGTAIPLGPGAACVIDADPSWRTAVTHMFLHGGWFHLIFNLWFLWVFGDNVEDAMGGARFVVFYVVCGIAAFATQAATNPSSAIPMVGASGAIGGVMGAYARLYPRAPVHLLVVFFLWVDRMVVPAFLMLGYWFVIQVLAGIPALASEAGGVAFWAHVGGFVAGILLIPLFAKRDRVTAHRRLIARYR